MPVLTTVVRKDLGFESPALRTERVSCIVPDWSAGKSGRHVVHARRRCAQTGSFG